MAERPFFSAEQLAIKPLLEYRYIEEPGSDGRFMVFFPGLGTRMDRQEDCIRRNKGTGVAYDSLVTSLQHVDRPFCMEELSGEVTQLIEAHQPSSLIFVGESFGAGAAISTAQHFQTSHNSVPIEAVVTLVPCINENSVNNGVAQLVKSLPPALGKTAVRYTYMLRDLLGKLRHDPSNRCGDINSQYYTALAIPKASYTAVDTNIHAFYSVYDRAINLSSSLRALEYLTCQERLFVYEIEANGFGNHTIRNEEFERIAVEHLVPVITAAWANSPDQAAQ